MANNNLVVDSAPSLAKRFREDPGARSVESWSVVVHVVQRGASSPTEGSEIDAIEILCGPKPMQRIRWLAQVAIARTDKETFQGWKRYGSPQKVYADASLETPLKLSGKISETIENNSEIWVVPTKDNVVQSVIKDS